MRIIATVRTRDEEKNIERFCMSYQWADQILVADGGSEDDTVSIAESMPKTQVAFFNERVELENGYWRNPSGEHINFLVEWAKDEGADWILFDDCDSVPNLFLRENGRRILRGCPGNILYAVRIYLWGKYQYLPKMSMPLKPGRYEPSLWGWRSTVDITFSSKENIGQQFDFGDTQIRNYKIYPPFCLLHNPWPSEEEIERKLKFYRGSGQISSMLHPKEFAGTPESLPPWAIE